MNLQDIYKPVEKGLALAESRLLAIGRTAKSPIPEAILPLLSAGGKRLRPALLLMAAKACDYQGKRAVNLAVAMELIHLASLIHDDVIDNSGLRRNSLTINSRWGNKISVLTGDYLLSIAVDLLLENADLRVVRIVTAAVRKTADGEIAQTLSPDPVDVTEAKYFSIISGKTASLISCCCRVGAMLQKACEGQAETLGEYGRNLGLAFQIADDILDVIGNNEELGKSARNDIREKTLTLPFIHAMSLARPSDRKWMKNTLSHGEMDESALSKMIRMVKEYAGIEYSLTKVKRYSDACRTCLKSIEDSRSRRSLALLADYVANRAQSTFTSARRSQTHAR